MGQQYLVYDRNFRQRNKSMAYHSIHHEASAEGTRAGYEEELQYHMTSNAQTQSLLAVERRHRNDALEKQASRWQTTLNLVMEGTEETHNEAQV